MVMSSRASFTTGPSSRKASSTARALRTASVPKMSSWLTGAARAIGSTGGGDAAVHVQDLAVDEGGLGAQEPGHGFRVVFLAPEPAQGDGPRTTCVLCLVIEAHGTRCWHRSGCDGIYAHATRAEFRGQRLCQRDDRSLHEAVDRGVRIAAFGDGRGHVDDCAAPFGIHVREKHLRAP